MNDATAEQQVRDLGVTPGGEAGPAPGNRLDETRFTAELWRLLANVDRLDEGKFPVLKPLLVAVRNELRRGMETQHAPQSDVPQQRQGGQLRTLAASQNIAGSAPHEIVKNIAQRFAGLGQEVAQQVHAQSGERLSMDCFFAAVHPALRYAAREYDLTDGQQDFPTYARPQVELCMRAAAAANWGEEPEPRTVAEVVSHGTSGFRAFKNASDVGSTSVDDEAQRRFQAWAGERGIPGECHQDRVLATTIYVMPMLHAQAISAAEHLRVTPASVMQTKSHFAARSIWHFDPQFHGGDILAYVDSQYRRQPNRAVVMQSDSKHTESGGETREDRFMGWVAEMGVPATSLYEANGILIDDNKSTMLGMVRQVYVGSARDMNYEVLSKAGYKLLKGLAWTFDPARHGTVFHEYVDRYLRPGLEKCIAAGQDVIPDRMNLAFLEGLTGADESPGGAIAASNLATNATDSGVAEESHVTSGTSVKAEDTVVTFQQRDGGSDPQAIAAEHLNADVAGGATDGTDSVNSSSVTFAARATVADGDQSSSPAADANEPESDAGRDERLMALAGRLNISADDAFGVQTELVRLSMSRIEVLVATVGDETGSGLSDSVLREAGQNVLNGLAWLFDPEQHGDDFGTYAEPYLRAGMQRCIEAGRNVVPENTDAGYLASLVPADAADPATAESASKNTPGGHVEEPEASPAVPIDPERAKAERQQRFLDWADEQLGNPCGTFAQAVKAICAQYEPKARSVANGTTILTGYGGGKKALRVFAIKKLPEVVSTFDPAGKLRIEQHIDKGLAPLCSREVGL